MSSLWKHHQELDASGVGRCSKPMWGGDGGEAGFCDELAYGPVVRPTGYWERGQFIPAYVPALACPTHGGPTREEAAAANAQGSRAEVEP